MDSTKVARSGVIQKRMAAGETFCADALLRVRIHAPLRRGVSSRMQECWAAAEALPATFLALRAVQGRFALIAWGGTPAPASPGETSQFAGEREGLGRTKYGQIILALAFGEFNGRFEVR